VALLGKAAVAMWWHVPPNQRAAFQDWHVHEHFPERLSIPGFRRGSRWAGVAAPESFFVMYELSDYDVLTSQHYRERLNAPTPWSLQMMPLHRGMVRSQCLVAESFGGGIAGFVLTIRISPQKGRADDLKLALRSVLSPLPSRAGLTGGHLLITQTPEAAATKEQVIRGADGVADWIILAFGYDLDALHALQANELSASALTHAGAEPQQIATVHRLSFALTDEDLGG
jgi:hypothetical protein